jgi:dTDP-4-dehydrorhamnose reductase
MQRLLITGAGGQLGRELTAEAARRGTAVVALTRAGCDITDSSAVAEVLDEHRPEALINCAAWTDVDGAETHEEAAFAVNEGGAGVLAAACAQRSVLLVHVSTDYVFGGAPHRPLDEEAAPSPLSVYGRSKLAGEVTVRARTPLHQIVRTSGLYGMDGPNFVLKVLQRAATGMDLSVVSDQVTAPTWTGHLAGALLRLAALRVPGTFHLTNTGSTSWHGFATAAVAAAGYDTRVRPVTSARRTMAARRPRYTVLDNRAWRRLSQAPLPHWRVALESYLAELRARDALPLAPGTTPCLIEPRAPAPPSRVRR